MKNPLDLIGWGRPRSPWRDPTPIREELFGIERLEQHAASLARAQWVSARAPRVQPLQVRLADNARVLLAAYRASAQALEGGAAVVPAAEWLLDNYHLVEQQVREIEGDLPPGFYRQLPKLSEGPFAGYPRVFGLAWAFVAHTDSHLDLASLRRFIHAYQRVDPLTIGELWAVAITLRIVLIENLRRLADQITASHEAQAAANTLAAYLNQAGPDDVLWRVKAATATDTPLSPLFAAELAKRLRDRDPMTTPVLAWLEGRLAQQESTIDDVVLQAQHQLGASNVSVRNVITSMRLMSDIDWTELVEDVSLVNARLSQHPGYPGMDFPTRNRYRSAIEQLARGSGLSEGEVTDRALAAARAPPLEGRSQVEVARRADPGHWLIGDGRHAFEQSLNFRPTLRQAWARGIVRRGISGYIATILVTATVLLGLGVWLIAQGLTDLASLWPFVILALVPATELATALVNRVMAASVSALSLPGLELSEGIPSDLRTVVAVPTLLTSAQDVLDSIERLDIHWLSGNDGDVTYALLVDGLDAAEPTLPEDAPILAAAMRAIAELNRRHGPGPAGPRFLLLHRRRVFNAGERLWMGWERKRGKLHELNRLLRGATDTTFVLTESQLAALPKAVRYVVTLDADTRLPRDAVQRLVGKMAHPLNRPGLDATQQRVVAGYGILQPRVTPSLPMPREGSVYQRVFSSPGGMDPYAAAASDIYQDVFGEGSYTGKGIYDIDAFEAASAGRVPDSAMLSHDLFEGVFARAGLASDIDVVEAFPARYDVAARRQHRWTRGDWQLLPWLFGVGAGQRGMPAIGRAKMLDNLRRSLLAPSVFLAVGACGLLPYPAGILALGWLLLVLVAPFFLPVAAALVPGRAVRMSQHLRALLTDLRQALLQSGLTLAFLADQAWRMSDAIVRTLWRLMISRRHLLEWTTAAQTAVGPRPRLGDYYRACAGGVGMTAVLAGALLWIHPPGWLWTLPLTLTWLAAPALALWTSRSSSAARQGVLTPAQVTELRHIARQTWRYFETFVTAQEHHLPPDNFQETPRPVIAHRTSPTNIGLYLLSVVAARDLGWSGTLPMIERLEATLASMRALPTFKGHFYNWYDTATGQPLSPAYLSSVDSGNLAAHLIVLANACEGCAQEPICELTPHGLLDHGELARQAVTLAEFAQQDALLDLLDEINAELRSGLTLPVLLPSLLARTHLLATLASACKAEPTPAAQEAAFWVQALAHAIHAHQRDTALDPAAIGSRLHVLASQARQLAMAMDFAFLLDPERRLLSIGYSLATQSLDESCYDLLASEARLASVFAIAKGDVASRHWLRLSRMLAPRAQGTLLVSWSGSMFEYLMPGLVMRAPPGSLLEQTNRRVVAAQIDYGRGLGVPWGVSESAFNARDIAFTYQYSNFGVPGLGLKRGLSDNVVIAPYATALAAMVDTQGALENFAQLAALGARATYGFYEALDFTPSRVPTGSRFAVVRSFMAHHQGMTIVALANALQDGRMRERFHREPMIQSSELLLQERQPRHIALEQPRAEDVHRAAVAGTGAPLSSVRRLSGWAGTAPATHLLSNGRYAVMLTAAGAGYSRWGDIAITRWRGDATRDHQGTFLYLCDVGNDRHWSPTAHPLCEEPEHEEAVFAEDCAEFTHRQSRLSTTLEVLVSGEDDSEVRRVSVVNGALTEREITLTTYVELALAPVAMDVAHPAFAKLFVVTEYLPEFGALVAHRRTRGADETSVWAAHFAVTEGHAVGPLEYETDRARFIGRGRDARTALGAQSQAPLSGTVGTVLDPVFALRRRVRVRPGHVARVTFWTVVASTREALLDLIDTHHDRSAFERARTLAWTQAQVQLRHLDIQTDEAADFQRLAAPLLYADARFRPSSAVIARGLGPQSALWQHAISGDLPIVLLRVDSQDDLPRVRQLLRAHEYWRLKQLAVDLVIINDRGSVYVQDLQMAIETAVRSSQSRPRLGELPARGGVFALRADLIQASTRSLLQSVARVALIARHGTLGEQLGALVSPPRPARAPRFPQPVADPTTARQGPPLAFFNGLGGFAEDGREYVCRLEHGQTTPTPWINVIANDALGFVVSADGSGFTWVGNSRLNPLTPWSNDPVEDPAGEALYVTDEATGEVWTPTAQPMRGPGLYEARHGFGYSQFDHVHAGIASSLLQFVPTQDPIKISRLRLRNLSGRTRRLGVTAYAEWVLGASREACAPFVCTHIDADTGALFARNPWNAAFGERVAFADLAGLQTAWTADRAEFLGRAGCVAAPAALLTRAALSGATGAGLDPCAALEHTVSLAPGASVDVVFFLGQAIDAASARELLVRYRAMDVDALLAETRASWRPVLQAIQVRTPDPAMDIMLNGWLLYQTLACRIRARAAFYQVSGAYGFRDQLQDGMALTFAEPAIPRAHLLRAAARQFVEGDVQHWWMPHNGQGVRTRISDDRLWLAYATASYVRTSGDTAVLDESVPFLEGPMLTPEQHETYFEPQTSATSASLREHCALGIDQCLALTGAHGLPLMGTGDWNDGMNRVGMHGQGESVWLGWLLIRTVQWFAPLVQAQSPERAQRWRAHADSVRRAIETHAWDGAWYRRATFDNGSWLGSIANAQCQIDMIAQSWATLSSEPNEPRAGQALDSVQQRLVGNGLARLFTPPFDHPSRDPGYIGSYPPGLRENGGQYSHAAMWMVLAFAQRGDGDRAGQWFSMLNPIEHARTPEAVQRYRVEPYVVAADIYSTAPHVGRGGWTWYTGSAAWMYRAGMEGILGIRREGDELVLDPCIPRDWPGFDATVTLGESRYTIRVDNPNGQCRGITQAERDGRDLPCDGRPVRVPLDGQAHTLRLEL